ncbi:MAG TPA: HAMP domain-containing sensor histidine kinase, partial [Roseiflexaceae bacterium]|nr:HAMP domain-containing sensor histidine kinase [Roseiflexaceae bacterium]
TAGWTRMLIESHQDYAMTPDTHVSLSGDLSDTAAFLQALAAAPDWQGCVDTLWQTLPHVLPGIRVDIYAAGPGERASLRFSSAERPVIMPAISSASDAQIRGWLEREGYSVIMTVPLLSVGRRCGWLSLARSRGAITSQAIALVRQITPLLALRLAYEQANSALEQQRSKVDELEHQLGITSTLRIRAMLAAGTAHNIGNLFTNVLGHAQMLESDVPALFQPDVRVIIRAIEDGRQLLHRLQNVKSDLSPDSYGVTSLQTIVQDTVQLTRPFWESRSAVDIETIFEQSLTVRARATDVREVLVNLIMNAVAAMPAGGLITIRCSRVGNYAAIAVTDTGQGIAREYHSAIFQPLTSTRADGSGLGLSVSRAIIEGYGGTLTVESAPGEGATFTITLPAQPVVQ